MEKILRVVSTQGFKKVDHGLDEVNKYLEDGWKVKHISACSMGDSSIGGQAYIVIEKED